MKECKSSSFAEHQFFTENHFEVISFPAFFDFGVPFSVIVMDLHNGIIPILLGQSKLRKEVEALRSNPHPSQTSLTTYIMFLRLVWYVSEGQTSSPFPPTLQVYLPSQLCFPEIFRGVMKRVLLGCLGIGEYMISRLLQGSFNVRKLKMYCYHYYYYFLSIIVPCTKLIVRKVLSIMVSKNRMGQREMMCCF